MSWAMKLEVEQKVGREIILDDFPCIYEDNVMKALKAM